MNTHIEYDPTQTIYTETTDAQGTLTAHILTNVPPLSAQSPQSAHPDLLCYFDTLDELRVAVKESYGQAAQYVGRTEFLAVMEHRGMSPSLLDA